MHKTAGRLPGGFYHAVYKTLPTIRCKGVFLEGWLIYIITHWSVTYEVKKITGDRRISRFVLCGLF